MIAEQQKRIWDLLDTKGLTLGEKMSVRSAFASTYKDEYPFIDIELLPNHSTAYSSTIVRIRNFRFESEEHVILANAIYENTKDNFNPNTFREQLTYTFRLLGIQSAWTK